MRVIRFNRKEAKLSEEMVRKLAKRFDVRRAEETSSGWKIPEPCPLCKGDNYCHCPRCPLYVFGDFGCLRLIKTVVPGYNEHFFLIDDCIIWDSEDDKIARRQLTKIRQAILDLPRI